MCTHQGHVGLGWIVVASVPLFEQIYTPSRTIEMPL
jgi:hypothetical protein